MMHARHFRETCRFREVAVQRRVYSTMEVEIDHIFVPFGNKCRRSLLWGPNT
jgi:hypothetical protein